MRKTKLGQHFLIDRSIVDQEIALANLSTDDIVLEVGPGKGVLTKELAKHCKTVIAVELDETLIRYLQKDLPSNVLLIHRDVLNLSWKDIPCFSKVVANLPFQISSPFTFKLFKTSFQKAILIYQKEFAERMIAQPGSKEYSRLSVGIAYKANCKIIRTIPSYAFSPPPEISSCLVELIPYSHPPFYVIDEHFFFQVTALLFSHRRKQIKTILKNKFLTELPDPIVFGSKRVEQLSPEEIGLLSNILFPFKAYLKSI
jgi:16S rRNA (adenine1518-N6/adenine1519-N6)-dimethyltransferase